ncbi:MAG TPA: hypothetical protein VEB65_02375 [Solirubrobacterales bacterium]|nr:hypothetical protein [Solirubrobacterales bacterium]
MEAECGAAIIGNGGIAVEVAYPESTPITVNSRLLLINGSVSGRTDWYLYAYFGAPIAGDLVIPVEIRRHRKGRYGTRAVATVPKIAGGYGSVRSFRLTSAKNVKGADGEIHHPVTGRCTDGKLQFEVGAKLADRGFRPTEVERACSPRA